VRLFGPSNVDARKEPAKKAKAIPAKITMGKYERIIRETLFYLLSESLGESFRCDLFFFIRSIVNIAVAQSATTRKRTTKAKPPPPGWVPPPCSPDASTMTPPRSSPQEARISMSVQTRQRTRAYRTEFFIMHLLSHQNR